MNHITRAVSFLSDLGIVILFKESDAVVLPENCGPEVSDQQITLGSRPSLCTRKAGRNIVGLSQGGENPVILVKEFKTCKQLCSH